MEKDDMRVKGPSLGSLSSSIKEIEINQGRFPLNFKVRGAGVVNVDKDEKGRRSNLVQIFSKWKTQVEDKTQTKDVSTADLLALRKFANEHMNIAAGRYNPKGTVWIKNFLASPIKYIGLNYAKKEEQKLNDSIDNKILQMCQDQTKSGQSVKQIVNNLIESTSGEDKDDKETQAIDNQLELLQHLEEIENPKNKEVVQKVISEQKAILAEMLKQCGIPKNLSTSIKNSLDGLTPRAINKAVLLLNNLPSNIPSSKLSQISSISSTLLARTMDKSSKPNLSQEEQKAVANSLQFFKNQYAQCNNPPLSELNIAILKPLQAYLADTCKTTDNAMKVYCSDDNWFKAVETIIGTKQNLRIQPYIANFVENAAEQPSRFFLLDRQEINEDYKNEIGWRYQWIHAAIDELTGILPKE